LKNNRQRYPKKKFKKKKKKKEKEEKLKKTFIKKCSTLPHIHTRNMGGNTVYISSQKTSNKTPK